MNIFGKELLIRQGKARRVYLQSTIRTQGNSKYTTSSIEVTFSCIILSYHLVNVYSVFIVFQLLLFLLSHKGKSLSILSQSLYLIILTSLCVVYSYVWSCEPSSRPEDSWLRLQPSRTLDENNKGVMKVGGLTFLLAACRKDTHLFLFHLLYIGKIPKITI